MAMLLLLLLRGNRIKQIITANVTSVEEEGSRGPRATFSRAGEAAVTAAFTIQSTNDTGHMNMNNKHTLL